MTFKTTLPAIGRFTLTMLLVLAAGMLSWRLWQYYEVEPWTRDGRVKADVVQVAPDVTGQVTAVLVHDNQEVKVGEVLFEIDRARFELALRQAEAAVAVQRLTMEQAQKESRRNIALRDLVAVESREQGVSRVNQARATLAQAVINRDVARLNLDRTRVLSAANGKIANLDLRSGSYVNAGHAVMAIIDSDSYYVEGYFEETKLRAIHIGDPVTVLPMGDQATIHGRVESLAGGIADRDRTTSSNLLSSVNPTFNWVRLAQRIPVRIKLDVLPSATRLVAGQTVTVDVQTNHS
ncbi:HlyD family secretion protein [Janthinobacterium sp.]|uniref:HlyD family secretion protein n=1 Tax=Janthinobacterium sp. TaxID=1871054 RepID=UPI00289E5EDE|nr:HlyD family secretion protein [Janthinobacterium sp.]